MKKALAILIPLCIIGFVGFWITSSILGPSNVGLVTGDIARTDNLSENNWSATDTIVNSEYTANIAANDNLTIELSNVKAVVKPTDADDIKVYVKNTSQRDVHVTLNRDGGSKTKILINTNTFGMGFFGINFNPFGFIQNDDIENRYVQIEVPKKTFESANIMLGSGNAEVKGITAEVYDIDLGSGKLVFDCGVTKSKKFKLDMGSGSGTFKGVTTEKYDINMGSGSCTISDLTGKGDIDMGSGSLEISFKYSPAGKLDIGSGYAKMIIPDNSDTRFKFDIGSGSANFDACGKSERKSNHHEDDIVLGSGANTFEIDMGSGKVDVESGNYVFSSIAE